MERETACPHTGERRLPVANPVPELGADETERPSLCEQARDPLPGVDRLGGALTGAGAVLLTSAYRRSATWAWVPPDGVAATDARAFALLGRKPPTSAVKWPHTGAVISVPAGRNVRSCVAHVGSGPEISWATTTSRTRLGAGELPSVRP
ncbi:hypothetical protein [Spirillospora sp. CA-128828]|uniref:hypothetical protein n=1 Tax=Spirillospora sp. CA-128828 TaxID=3240033 RepID=UPI003D8A0163